MKVCFETFGCRLNRAEALEEEAKYLARGWELTDSHEDAQLIVVRGCSVTQRAQRDCERLIDHIKRKYPFKRVIITGCLPSANKSYTIRGLAGIARKPTSAGGPGVQAPSDVPQRTARAYLKVQDGCNGHCTFCIVPQFRGPSKSEPFDALLDKAKRFIEVGYHEIVVTGCNLSMYASGGKRLPELLSAFAELDPNCRIRLGSLEPGPIALDTVHAIAEHENLCRFLHIPVQSGSERILSAMRRPYRAKDVDALVREAVRLMPDIGLGCDILTGFPDEMDNDFLATKALFKRLPFSNAHVFPYSERPDTFAATLPNAIPSPIRSARAHEIADLANVSRNYFVKRFKGRVVEIVIEDEKNLAGWTSEYVWCQIGAEKAKTLSRYRGATERTIKRKDLVKVLVREVHEHVLTGDPT